MKNDIATNPIIMVDDLKSFVNEVYVSDMRFVAEELNKLSTQTSNNKSKLILQGLVGSAMIIGVGAVIFAGAKKIDSLEHKIKKLENGEDSDDLFDDDQEYREI